MAESIEDVDGYLIPGIGLNHELLDQLSAKGNSVGSNSYQDAEEFNSLKNGISIKMQSSMKATRQKIDSLNSSTATCSNNNIAESICSKSVTHAGIKSDIQADCSAWSVDIVTVKSGKHRTNRVGPGNQEQSRTSKVLESANIISGVNTNRIIPLNYGKKPSCRHPYIINSGNPNCPPARRFNGPHRLKPLLYTTLRDKDTVRCTDTLLKGPNVNKQMANVSEGILTVSPAADDICEGVKVSRGVQQTTVLNCHPGGSVAHQDIVKMEKKRMMKRQCMYFPVDDYVTLSPITAVQYDSVDNQVNQSRKFLSHRKIKQLTNERCYEKQLSPMTISSGYESDYSPPWPTEMEDVFNKMVESVCSNYDDSHTDYFSQSETYPRSMDIQGQFANKTPGAASGPADQLIVSNTEGESNDGYDYSQRSRSNCIHGEKSLLTSGLRQFSVDNIISEHVNSQEINSHKSTSEKYVLDNDSPRSSPCDSTNSSSVSLSAVSELRKDLENNEVKPLRSSFRRSKRYRYDASRESLCRVKSLNIGLSSTNLAKPLGDFEMQTTCEDKTSPRITPIDIFGLFKKSPISRQCLKNEIQTPTIIDTNFSDRLRKYHVSNNSQVKTNVSHGYQKCVGDIGIDKTKQVVRNSNNLGCAKSPRGKCDSDYEHIYDVIPGDENLTPSKQLPTMAVDPLRRKWTTLQDISRSKNFYGGNPPALPVRSYLKTKGNNSINTMSSAPRIVCSSVDDLYARVHKTDGTTGLYASSLKGRPTIFDISNKENVYASTSSKICDNDYEYLSPETYCRIGSSMEDEATRWTSGDILNFIDGIEQPEPKRRDNIYGLLSSKNSRQRLSESLEIEHKLVNMGLLRNSWSCENVEAEEKPPKIPPRVPLNTLRPIYV